MFITACGTELTYEKFDADGERTVVFLHGWGGGLESFRAAYSAVCSWGVNCINLAFPTVVPSSFGIYDYAACAGEALDALGAAKPILVGHSFGGRVATILAARGKAEKLLLTAAAGMKPRFDIVRAARIAAYKRKKKSGKPLDGMGSKDYNNLGREMREVFVRVVNTHLEKLLPYISCETLLYWGRSDKDTPPYMAKRLNRGIKNSRLVMTDGGHFAYLENSFEFINELKSFVLEL